MIKKNGTSKLTRRQYAALLTLGFGEYTSDSGKLETLRSRVDVEIQRGESDKDYWRRMRDGGVCGVDSGNNERIVICCADAPKRKKVDKHPLG